MKKFLIIAGIVILVIIIGGGIYVYINKDNLANMAMEQSLKMVEQVTLDNLTANYNREEVKSIISNAKIKLKEKGFSAPELQSLVVTFQHATEDKQLDSLEVKNIIDQFKEIAEE